MNRTIRTIPLIGTVALLLTAIPLSAQAIRDYSDLFGGKASASAANRILSIGPDTSYVNVTGGETVTFIVGDRTFAWNFNVGKNIWEIDLNKLAPPGLLDHVVKVYIKQNPIYD